MSTIVSISNEKASLVEYQADNIKLRDESKSWDHFMIGQGGFANVYEVRIDVPDKDENGVESVKAALKKFKFDRFATDKKGGESELSKLKRGASIVSQTNHPHIIELFGVCFDDHFFGLLLELCEGGSLGSVCRSIRKPTTIALRILADWSHQISSAMKYLTDRNYIHRDLKADNVLVKELVCFCSESEVTPLDCCQICEGRPLNKLQLKISDFGLSKTTTSVGDSLVGTFVWLAPEVFQKNGSQSNWTEFSDVWSFGVLLWEILAREMPHSGVYPIVVAHWNQEGQTLQLKDNWPQKWKDIMNQCWSMDPKNRPTFNSLVEYFEEYTKGLVEVHISDLPKEKKERKDVNENVICCFPSRSALMPNISNNQNGRLSSQLNQKAVRRKRTICVTTGIILSIALFISSIIIAYFVLRSAATPDSLCSEGYDYFNSTGFCYKTTATPVTQKEAADSCKNDGALLASIHTIRENDFIRSQYIKAFKKYRVQVDPFAQISQVWIGLEYDQWSDWVWSDKSDNSYTNFKKEGNVAGGFWTILYPAEKGQWGVATDTKEAAFTCKKPIRDLETTQTTTENLIVNKECSPGYTWLKTTGFCYKIEFNPTSYQDAIENCAKDNSRLVSIHSEQENNEIVKFHKSQLTEKYQDRAFVKRNYIWTGLTLNENSEWEWSDGTSYDYSNWIPNRPDRQDHWMVIGIETERHTESAKTYWRDVGLDNFFSFICQKRDISLEEEQVLIPERAPIDAPVVDKNLRNCSTGYTYFDKTGYCYKSGTSNANFTVANRSCSEDNAHLVSVHSKEENTFVINLAKEAMNPMRIYTGLYYPGNQWVYTDGSALDFTNWMKGEPNFIYSDLANSEVHATIMIEDFGDANVSHDKWNNQMGKYKYGYVYYRVGTPTGPTTVVFAYSNDFPTQVVKDALSSIRSNYFSNKEHFVRFSAYRFDCEESYYYFGDDFDDFYKNVLSHLPNASLALSENVQSDAINVLWNHVRNSDLYTFGSQVFLLMKRYSSTSNFGNIVDQLREKHIFIQAVGSNSSIGTWSPLSFYDLATKTNGLFAFCDDNAIGNIMYRYAQVMVYSSLVYAVNPKVSGHGNIKLPLFDSSALKSGKGDLNLHLHATVADDGSIANFQQLRLIFDGTKWFPIWNKDLRNVTTLDALYGSFDVGVPSYTMTLGYDYDTSIVNSVQIRLYIKDPITNWLPYAD